MRFTIFFALLLSAYISGCDCDHGNKLCFGHVDEYVVLEYKPDLEEPPDLEVIAAHYCESYFDTDDDGEACTASLGTPKDLGPGGFDFNMRVTVMNRGSSSITVKGVLLSVQLYKGVEKSNIGARCLDVCKEDEPGCGEAPPEEACKEASVEMGGGASGWLDFADTNPNLVEGLVSGDPGLIVADTRILGLGSLDLDLDIRLDTGEVIDVIGTKDHMFMDTLLQSVEESEESEEEENDLFSDFWDDLNPFEGPSLHSIPVFVSGTVFVENADGQISSTGFAWFPAEEWKL